MVHHVDQQSIANVILSALLAGEIRPGTRPGESQVAQMSGVSGPRVREAMLRPEARGVVEAGLLHAIAEIPPGPGGRLGAHLGQDREALASGDVAGGVGFLGDFHARLAENMGNPVLVEIRRGPMAGIAPIPMLDQPRATSCESKSGESRPCESSRRPCGVVDALEARGFAQAVHLMDDHVRAVEAAFAPTANSHASAGLKAVLPGA